MKFAFLVVAALVCSSRAALADDCDGLMPVGVAAPVVVAPADSYRPSCEGDATSDGNGTFFLRTSDSRGGNRVGHFYQIGADGSALQVGDPVRYGDYSNHTLASQASGFVDLATGQANGIPGYFGAGLGFYTTDGNGSSYQKIASFDDQVFAFGASDPNGGIAILREYQSSPGLGSFTLQRFGADAAAVGPETPVQQGALAFEGLAVAGSGNALVLWRDGTQHFAMWFDSDGNALTDPFAVPVNRLARGLDLLADGSLALREASRAVTDESYTLQFPDAQALAVPAPAWLAARGAVVAHLIRQGAGYALWGNGGACGRNVEIVAASGQSCGCMNGPTIATPSSAIGLDGTWIVGHQEPNQCSFEVYPNLFQ